MENIFTKPCVSARAVIVKDQKILLVNGGDERNLWVLPGGRMDYGENLKLTCKREVYEETGLTINVGNAFCVDEFLHDDQQYHVVNVFFYCTIVDGDLPQHWTDVAGTVVDRKFFTLDELQNIDARPAWLTKGEWLDQSGTDIYRGQDVRK